MKKGLSFLKQIWLVRFVYRTYFATRYYNSKYTTILHWGLQSNELTNFTYALTPSNIGYLTHTIAVVLNKEYKEVFDYILELQNNTTLKKEISTIIQSSPHSKYADKDIHFSRRLGWYAFVRIMKPKIVIETGVDKGLGAIVICEALHKNISEGFDGTYFGTDINPQAGYLLTEKYKDVGKILYGDSITSLLKFTNTIDLFINDSDHSSDYEYKEYKTIQHLLTPTSIILGDNANSTDKLSEFARETGMKFLYFKEEPQNHWYPGAGIGIAFR